MVVFLNKHYMLFQFQFGFREGHSTTLALTEIIDNIKNSIDNNQYTIGIFLDLCKAFDTVDHSILLQKLKYYGIRGNAHSLLSSYLTGRTQFTLINNVKSDLASNAFGVPQGSVLGPLLFLIYINDIQFCIPDKHTRLFADDTGIFVSGNNLFSIIESSQAILNKLEAWFICNKLTISVSKCAWMIFHGKNKRLPDVIPGLYLSGVEMTKVDSYKYIGLILDSKLTWKQHVNAICSRLNQYFGIFFHIRNKIPFQMTRQVYFSTVFAHINFGLEIYGSCPKSLKNKLQSKQNQLLKVLTNKERLYPTNELHAQNRILKIEEVYNLKIISFVHDCLNENTIPLFHDYFKLQHQTHSYPTRHILNIIQPKVKTNMGSSSIKSMGASLWNNSEVARSNFQYSKTTLKKNMTSFYINSYL